MIFENRKESLLFTSLQQLLKTMTPSFDKNVRERMVNAFHVQVCFLFRHIFNRK